MFDYRLPKAKAVITQGHTSAIEITQPSARQGSVIIEPSGNTESTNCFAFANYQKDSIVKNRHQPNLSPIFQTDPRLDSWNVEQCGIPHTPQVGLKDTSINLTVSMSPDALEPFTKLLELLFTPRDSGGQTAPTPPNPPDNFMRDILLAFLASKQKANSLYGVDDSKEFQNNVTIVWEKIKSFNKDVFKKADLTIALQKKLNASEIGEVLQFLISEGGVIEELEQPRKNSNGGAPSPQYRLLWENPKYQFKS